MTEQEQKYEQSNELTILGATYGINDVTSTVKNLISKNNTLDFVANDGTLQVTGSWFYNIPSCVVVYTYDYIRKGEEIISHIAYVKQGATLKIDKTSTWPRKLNNSDDGSLTIYGAVYGGGKSFLGDVTLHSTGYISNNSFEQVADNATFGDSWYNVFKSFTIVYAYRIDNIMVKVVAENSKVSISL